jgi:ABC-type cobalamin transport system permease subunit
MTLAQKALTLASSQFQDATALCPGVPRVSREPTRVFADFAGRMILPPAEIPAGILTSIVGVPFFLYLLWKREKS